MKVKESMFPRNQNFGTRFWNTTSVIMYFELIFRMLTISKCFHLLLSRNSWTLSMLPCFPNLPYFPNHPKNHLSKSQSGQRKVFLTKYAGKTQNCKDQAKKPKSESKSKKTRHSKPRSKKPSKSNDQKQPNKISHSIFVLI